MGVSRGGAISCPAQPARRRAVLPRARLAKQRHQHICSPGVMRPLLRGPAGNDDEESSDSTPLLPGARQTEAGELRDHRVIASGSVPGGRVVPGRGRLEGVAAGSGGQVAAVVLWVGLEVPVALAGLKQFRVGGVSDPSQ